MIEDLEDLIEGSIVHYVTSEGKHEPAMVIEVFNKAAGYVSLRNFADLKTYATTYHSGFNPDTWHWIETWV